VEEANLEIIKRWAEAIQEGDLAEELWDPNLEIVNAKGWALEATYHGYEGLHRWWSDLAEAFSDLAMQVEEITPVDDELVLTVQRFLGHFRTTGIRFDAPWASILTVRGGRIMRAVGYRSKRGALRALEPGT
jgi:ketosteroid isomerase-like protein